MKKLWLFFFLLVFSWCTNTSSTQNTLVQEAPIDCSAPNYYENINLKKSYKFMWDEENSAFVTKIPELCLKISSFQTTNYPPNERREVIETYFSWHLDVYVENNTIFLDNEKNPRYIIRNKDIDSTLQDEIQNHYYLGVDELNEDIIFKGEKFCQIKENPPTENNFYTQAQLGDDENSSYLINTPYLIASKHWIKSKIYSQFCGESFPYAWENFWIYTPYKILYNQKFPQLYILYSPLYGNSGESSFNKLKFEIL